MQTAALLASLNCRLRWVVVSLDFVVKKHVFLEKLPITVLLVVFEIDREEQKLSNSLEELEKCSPERQVVN